MGGLRARTKLRTGTSSYIPMERPCELCANRGADHGACSVPSYEASYEASYITSYEETEMDPNMKRIGEGTLRSVSSVSDITTHVTHHRTCHLSTKLRTKLRTHMCFFSIILYDPQTVRLLLPRDTVTRKPFKWLRTDRKGHDNRARLVTR